MKNLKRLRQERGLSQKQAADQIGVSQQTFGRWERGVDEPSMPHLRDLAITFDTSTEYLLGKTGKANQPSHNWDYTGNPSSDAFWGHLGLKFPFQENTIWWPITTKTVAMIRYSSEAKWLAIPTLANRLLIVNMAELEHLWLLDDACDQPEDWHTEGMPYSGAPLDFYRALQLSIEEGFDEEDDFEHGCSEALQNAVREFRETHGLDNEDKILDITENTKIILKGGKTHSYHVDEEQIEDICLCIDPEYEWMAPERMLALPKVGGELEAYYPINQVLCLEVPLTEIGVGDE